MISEPGETPVERPWHRQRLLDGSVLLAAAILLTAIRLHAFGLPLERDECNYAYVGARLLAGDRLYVDVWDHQPPGVFVLFAGVTAALGDSPEVFRWLAMVASLGSLALVFAIARRTAGALAGYFAALLFAMCSADPGTAGEGCNREIFMNVFALAAVWLLVRCEDLRRGDVLAAGLLLGLGSTLKTVMAAQWLLLGTWLVVCTWRQAQPARRVRLVAGSCVAFAIGPALVWGGTSAYFAATGRFGDFFEATFLFNLGYSDVAAGYGSRFIEFFTAPVHRHVFDGTGPLWISAGLAAVLLPVLRYRKGFRTEGALLCYLIGSYGAVCVPGLLWPHYYYLMLPPLVIVLAAATGHLARLPVESSFARPGRWIAFGASGVIFVSLLVLQARVYLLVPTLRITQERYDSRDLWARAQGQNVARVTDPQDTVLVYGDDVGVYYYSDRRCATRYTMIGSLDERHAGFERRRDILLEEIESRRPRVVLVVEEPFPALDAHLRANYYLIGQDHHDHRPDEVVMIALMDKSRPVQQIDWNWHRSSVLGR